MTTTVKYEEFTDGINTQESIDPLGDGISKVTLLKVLGTDLDIVNAARVSYNKHSTEFTAKDEKLLRFLLTSKPPHTSVLEHNQLRYRVKLPLFCIREWHRHRHWSFNEISGRYIEFGKDFPLEFYRPAIWRHQSKTNRQASADEFEDEAASLCYVDSMHCSIETYHRLIEHGVARELARCVLPLAVYTEMYATCNMVALLHFLRLRLHKDAQEEIRKYAQALLTLAEPYFPHTIKIWRESCQDNPLINPALTTSSPTTTAQEIKT